MGVRLPGKTAIIVGAGQTQGDNYGNGRAMAILFAREGARVMLVDRDLDAAMETKALIDKDGGKSFVFQADVTNEENCREIARVCDETYGGIDILVNNVGIGSGDSNVVSMKEDDFSRILDVNLKGMVLTCKHVLPVMERDQKGAILNISSTAATCYTPIVAYKVSKAGVNALTQQLAIEYAGQGIRVNAIMMGLLDTPMAINGWVQATGMDKDKIRVLRNGQVPLRGGQGDAWDTAYAALFLVSDEAKFITGINLCVDGGQCAKIGL